MPAESDRGLAVRVVTAALRTTLCSSALLVACGDRTGLLAPDDTTPPSCALGGPGMTDCGANKESCCRSLLVQGGTFYRTYANDGSGPAGEADPASVSTFRLDKYDVTVGRFRQFVGAWSAGWTPPAGSGKHAHLNGGRGLADSGHPGNYEDGWVSSDDVNLTPTKTLGSCGTSTTWRAKDTLATLPINCLNWYEAYAFCIWDQGFLPSEAEWAYAAAGGSQEREYPWGSAAPGTTNQYAIYGCNYPSGSGMCSMSNIAAVGTATLGAGLWGQVDLAGNVAQWTFDYSDLVGGYAAPCVDCAAVTLPGSSEREIRGGDYDVGLSNLRSANRENRPPLDRDAIYGLRCARLP